MSGCIIIKKITTFYRGYLPLNGLQKSLTLETHNRIAIPFSTFLETCHAICLYFAMTDRQHNINT